jgi:hypothetical protein
MRIAIGNTWIMYSAIESMTVSDAGLTIRMISGREYFVTTEDPKKLRDTILHKMAFCGSM